MKATNQALIEKHEKRFLYSLCLTGSTEMHSSFQKEFFPTLEERGLIKTSHLSKYILWIEPTLKGFATI